MITQRSGYTCKHTQLVSRRSKASMQIYQGSSHFVPFVIIAVIYENTEPSRSYNIDQANDNFPGAQNLEKDIYSPSQGVCVCEGGDLDAPCFLVKGRRGLEFSCPLLRINIKWEARDLLKTPFSIEFYSQTSNLTEQGKWAAGGCINYSNASDIMMQAGTQLHKDLDTRSLSSRGWRVFAFSRGSLVCRQAMSSCVLFCSTGRPCCLSLFL